MNCFKNKLRFFRTLLTYFISMISLTGWAQDQTPAFIQSFEPSGIEVGASLGALMPQDLTGVSENILVWSVMASLPLTGYSLESQFIAGSGDLVSYQNFGVSAKLNYLLGELVEASFLIGPDWTRYRSAQSSEFSQHWGFHLGFALVYPLLPGFKFRIEALANNRSVGRSLYAGMGFTMGLGFFGAAE